MNSQDKLDLAEIAEGQRHVHRLIVRLDERIETLRRRIAAVETKPPQPTPATASAVMAPAPLPSAAVEPPPLPHERRAVRMEPLVQPPERKPAPVVKTAPETSASVAETADTPKKIEQESFELRLGTFWLVRIGVVIFLTGLVFLGNFAYHHFIAQLGAGGKLALLYLAGATLAGVGAWLDRKQEAMRNYARVLMAGGAAAIYYTTYAAHYVERLRVIESPLLGGILLLALAGGIVWLAERKRSEALALLAALLAYYTSAINALGAFTLFSSVLLTAVAIFLLVRHGWSRLSWVSLAGTYASYAFWRFHGLVAHGVSGSADFGTAFLAGYWILFTVAVFMARPGLSAAQRMPFLTANNAAFFVLAAQHFATHWPGSFWIFALVFGGVLLALTAIASRRFHEDSVLDGAFLAQGLALITVGLVAKLNGYQLAVTLAAESAVLLTCSRWRHGILYQFAAAGMAAGAAFLAVAEMERSLDGALALGTAVTALLLFDAWWFKRVHAEPGTLRFDLRTAWFAVLGLFVAGALIWEKTNQPWQSAVFALAACACAVSLPFARLPEVALCGHGLFAIGVLACLGRHAEPTVAYIPVIVAALALEQWWQRQRTLSLVTQLRDGLQLTCAIGAVVVGFQWMEDVCTGDAWMLVAAAAGLAAFAYALITRSWAILLAGQVFTLAAIGAFATGTAFRHPDWRAALAPMISLLAISYGARRFGSVAFPELDRVLPFANIAAAARVTAFAVAGGWVFEYVADVWQVPVFAGLGATLLLFGGFSHNRSRTGTGAALSVLALALFCARFDVPTTLPQLLAILAIPAAARFAVRFGRAEHSLSANEQNLLVAGSLVTVWLWVTRWTLAYVNASNLTVAWSVLALIVLGAGFALRERVYRLGGLAILALAVGRIFLIDVWQLETIYRILSFLVLGTVLLVLGLLTTVLQKASSDGCESCYRLTKRKCH